MADLSGHIVLARLERVASRLLVIPVSRMQAVAEVRSISTDPAILGEAAGRALAAWQIDSVEAPDGRAISHLLIEAGASLDVLAAAVERELAEDPT